MIRSLKFPNAPPIIIEYINLSVFSDMQKIQVMKTITNPMIRVTKLYINDELVLNKPNPIPLFQIKSMFT